MNVYDVEPARLENASKGGDGFHPTHGFHVERMARDAKFGEILDDVASLRASSFNRVSSLSKKAGQIHDVTLGA